MNKALRLTFNLIQGLLTMALSFIAIITFIVSKESHLAREAQAHLYPALIQIWVTFLISLLIITRYRANLGSEAELLPVLFLTIILSNIKILPLHQAITGTFLLDGTTITFLYHGSLLYAAFLFLVASLLLIRLAPSKIGLITFVGMAGAIILALLVPSNPNDPSFLLEVGISDSLFLAIIIILTAIAALTYLVTIISEETNRETSFKALAFLLLSLGNAFVATSQRTTFNIVGLLLYTAGSVVLLLISRSYHL